VLRDDNTIRCTEDITRQCKAFMLVGGATVDATSQAVDVSSTSLELKELLSHQMEDVSCDSSDGTIQV